MTPDPASPRNGCISGSDDFISTDDSRIANYDIAPGERVWAIPSTFSNNTTGDWSLEIASQ